MIKYICDKCGTEMGIMTTYRVYSFSQHRLATLCLKCLKAHEKAIEKADEKFFKESNNDT